MEGHHGALDGTQPVLDEGIEDWESADYNAVVISQDVAKSTPLGTASSSFMNTYDIERDSDWESDDLHAHVPEIAVVDKVGEYSSANIISHEEDSESTILILVNLTSLSEGKIHNKFDKYSVNDQEAKKRICAEISANYDSYANNSALIMNQTVRHCSEIVWRDALESLRSQYKGQYWYPFFPPKIATLSAVTK